MEMSLLKQYTEAYAAQLIFKSMNYNFDSNNCWKKQEYSSFCKYSTSAKISLTKEGKI